MSKDSLVRLAARGKAARSAGYIRPQPPFYAKNNPARREAQTLGRRA